MMFFKISSCLYCGMILLLISGLISVPKFVLNVANLFPNFKGIELAKVLKYQTKVSLVLI